MRFDIASAPSSIFNLMSRLNPVNDTKIMNQMHKSVVIFCTLDELIDPQDAIGGTFPE